MRDARVKSNPGWCPAKAAPGGRLLRTFPCWPSLGWPRAGHPQTCSKKLLSSGYQCRPGSSMTSNLPSFPQLLHTAAHAVLSRERLTGASCLSSVPLAIYTSSRLPRALGYLLWCRVRSKVFLGASLGWHSAHQEDWCFPNWGPQRFCLHITCGAENARKPHPKSPGSEYM